MFNSKKIKELEELILTLKSQNKKSQEEINEIFEDEWRKVYSRFIS